MDQELLFFSLLGAGLLVVLFVHELGHLLAARHYGVKVLSLSVGFGPQLISFTDNLGTSWKLRAIPIGGSCVIDDNSKLKNSPAEKRANSKFRLGICNSALSSSPRDQSLILHLRRQSLFSLPSCAGLAVYITARLDRWGRRSLD
jgi:membrane-associated protease RseP (regulator of RpoE activity)